ncbi:MAG: hypothetical protein CMQ40_12875 [Gammaproteobacteria bacterium]|nr:hypothetical protein [Gammaproteobacteria bacterium]|tara:strand:- start:2848 stop:3846 length:999 start_codon:yes stop_codon:yes gene_type:complete
MASSSTAQLVFNAFDRILTYQGVQKQLNDDFWDTKISPIIRPLWDSDKDRLELFVYREDGTYLIQRSKYRRDHKTKTSKWTSYEFDPSGIEEYSVSNFYDKLREQFFEFKDISEAQYEQAVRRKIEEANILSWDKILLVRMFLLGDCDWTQLGDNGLTDEKKAMWLAYRKWIRDNPKTNAQKQDAETAYDVIFPITPDEYLKRKETGVSESALERYGQQGNDKDYLDSDYHFWKLSANSLSYFAQKMSVYLVLTTITRDNIGEGTFGRIDINNYRSKINSAQPPYQFSSEEERKKYFGADYNGGEMITNETVEEKGQAWLDDLISRIEAGEV